MKLINYEHMTPEQRLTYITGLDEIRKEYYDCCVEFIKEFHKVHNIPLDLTQITAFVDSYEKEENKNG